VTLISVLVPVLNEEHRIAETIASILAQPGADLEVLVADGRSADKTAAVVARIAASDSRVRLLDNPKLSIPAALNLCLQHSRGEFVARVDGHSELSADYFRRALATLSESPAMGGVGGHRVGVGRTPVGRAIALVQSSRFAIGNSIYHYADRAQLTDHATFGVYRAEAVRQIGGWDEQLIVNEDVDFDHRLRAAGWTIGYQPAMTVRWDVRERIGDLFAQYRRYGRGKAGMVRKNGPSAVRPRHLVPPTAVGGGFGLLIGGVIERWLLAGFAPYLALVFVASALAWRRRATTGRTSAAALPAAFLVIHVGWGLGFMEGLLGRKPARASGSGAVRSEADASLLAAIYEARGTPPLNPRKHNYEEVSRKRDVATSVPPT
jgi:succinoglycan biosynthesis protein ExoA